MGSVCVPSAMLEVRTHIVKKYGKHIGSSMCSVPLFSKVRNLPEVHMDTGGICSRVGPLSHDAPCIFRELQLHCKVSTYGLIFKFYFNALRIMVLVCDFKEPTPEVRRKDVLHTFANTVNWYSVCILLTR